MENIIEFLEQINKLKKLKRKGWVIRCIPNPESVADHSFRVSVMALMLAKKFNLDENKCIKLSIIHDLAESIVGDITPYDNISNLDKEKLELEAMKKLTNNLDNSDIYKIFKEYIEQKTLEAKFVYQIDKIEMLLQAYEYELKHGKKVEYSAFLEYVSKRVTDPELIKLIKIIESKRK